MKNYRLRINGNGYDVEIRSVEGNMASVSVNGTEYQVEIERSSDAAMQPARPSVPTQAPVPAATPAGSSSKEVTSPLPGVIVGVNVKVGDTIKVGQEVAVLEAMKMENSIESAYEGTVTSVRVANGDSVLEGDTIVTIG